MYRRAFLAGAAGGAVALTAGESRANGAGPAVLRSYLTSLRASPALNESLQLRRDPFRRFDPGSIAALDARGRHLGYLPSDQSRTLGPLIEAGAVVTAKVVEVRSGPRPLVVIAITLGPAQV